MNRKRLLATAALTAGLALAAMAVAQAEDPAPGPEAPCPVGAGKGPLMRERGDHPGRFFRPPEMWRGLGMRMMNPVDFYLAPGNPLGLSEAQLTQLRAQSFEFRKANVARRAAMETAELELEQLRQATPVDAKKVEAKIRELFSQRADLAVAVFQAQQQADQILTAEQRTKAREMPLDRPCRMKAGMRESEEGPEN